MGHVSHGGMTALSSGMMCAGICDTRAVRTVEDRTQNSTPWFTNAQLRLSMQHAAQKASRSDNGQAAQDGGCASRAVHGGRYNAACIAGALARREQPWVAHALARLSVPHNSQLQHAQAASSVGEACVHARILAGNEKSSAECRS